MPNDEDAPRVPIVCPECDTTSRVSLSDVADVLERHNDQRHDGEEVATVAPEIVRHVTDLVARDMGLVDDE